jgi:hypothetical protein
MAAAPQPSEQGWYQAQLASGTAASVPQRAPGPSRHQAAADNSMQLAS